MKKYFLIISAAVIFIVLLNFKTFNKYEEYTGKIVSRENFCEDDIKIYIPSLKNGKAVILILPTQECVLIDCGSGEDFPALYRILRDLDINVIDLITLTSFEEDSCGGLDKVLDNFKVCELYAGESTNETGIYEKICNLSIMNNVRMHKVCEGTRIYEYQKTSIDVVCTHNHPFLQGTAFMNLYIVCGNRSIFIEGESNIAAEARMAAELKGVIESDILITTGNIEELDKSRYFLEEINPKYVAMCIYGKKRPPAGVTDVLQGTEVIRTDINGNISFIASEDGINVKIDK